MPRAKVKTKRPYTPTPAQQARDERLRSEFAAKRAEKAAAADKLMALVNESEQLAKEQGMANWPVFSAEDISPKQAPAPPVVPAQTRERDAIQMALFSIVLQWPTMMDRLRWQKPGLFGVNFVEQVDKVRAFTAEAWLLDRVLVAEQTAEVWAIVQEWPAIVRRATYGGASLSLAEYGELNEAERLLAELKELGDG